MSPTVPLTLRGMRRPRHRPLRKARLSFSLLSVLALLVAASVPALAQAECTDSSCAQYEVEIPTSGGKEKTKKPTKATDNGKEGKAETSTAKPSEEKPSSEGKSDGEEEENEKGGTAPAGNNNGGGGQGNNGSPGGSGNGGEKLGNEQSLGNSGNTTQGKPASSSSGGSSPLVPILIAVAVLAAISIGAVIYRQRRQDDGGSGSPVSPKAG